ncbi:hypothetical protein ABIB57_005258 [Devosia sp. UYZn731]|uniref:hypothetical protein n=1 Tax=Devosia sp. UYZn731 TaxID=3156345 RepID=UPI00339B0A53
MQNRQFDPLTLLEPVRFRADQGPTRGEYEIVVYGIDPKTLTVESMICSYLEVMCGDHPDDVGAWLLTNWDEIGIYDIDVLGTDDERHIHDWMMQRLQKCAAQRDTSSALHCQTVGTVGRAHGGNSQTGR